MRGAARDKALADGAFGEIRAFQRCEPHVDRRSPASIILMLPTSG
jgi:hypothetical protein